MDRIQQMLTMARRHLEDGRLPQAERLLQQVLQQQPHPEAVHLLGVVALQQNNVDGALELLEQAISLSPGDPAVLQSLGTAHLLKEELDQAAVCFRRALTLDPQSAEALCSLGQVTAARGDLDAALELAQQAVGVDPRCTRAHALLGTLHTAQQELRAAVACFGRALELDPDDWQVISNLGLLYQQLGDLELAEEHLQQAMMLDPGNPVVSLNLASVLLELGQFEQAEKLSREATVLMPKQPPPHNNLGLALLGLGRVAEALLALLKALSLNPDDAQARVNLGSALRLEGKIEKALECYDRALASEPEFARAQHDRATALLLLGRYEEGWPGLGARRRIGGIDPPPHPLPSWGGGDAAGETVLVWSDGGLAEALLLLRLVPRLKEQGAGVALECPPAVERLLAGADLADELVPPGMLPNGALQVSLDELPLRLGIGPDDGPPPLSLPVSQKLAAAWSERLAHDEPAALTIGFLWRGENQSGDPHQAVPLEAMAPLWGLEGTRWLSLQYQTTEEEAALLGGHEHVADLATEISDFSDALACLTSLDLLITPESAVAHLAGAAGIPVWVLLPNDPAWWWGMGETSPWYPDARLFRRESYGQWTGVVQRVRASLLSTLNS